MPRPSSSSNFDEDIAERRVSDALATTLLLVAALCLVGAIAIQGYECYLYRVDRTTTLVDAAKVYVKNLKSGPEIVCGQIKTTFDKANEEKPKKGHIEGPNFIIDEPVDLPDDLKAAVETLCKEYGYGYKVFAPVAKGTGAEAKKPAEEGAEPPEEKPADEAADKTEEKPADEAADKTEEMPADEAADKTEETPADEAADKTEEKPADEEADGSTGDQDLKLDEDKEAK